MRFDNLFQDDERDDEISRGHRFQQLLDEERKVERRINNVKRVKDLMKYLKYLCTEDKCLSGAIILFFTSSTL